MARRCGTTSFDPRGAPTRFRKGPAHLKRELFREAVRCSTRPDSYHRTVAALARNFISMCNGAEKSELTELDRHKA